MTTRTEECRDCGLRCDICGDRMCATDPLEARMQALLRRRRGQRRRPGQLLVPLPRHGADVVPPVRGGACSGR